MDLSIRNCRTLVITTALAAAAMFATVARADDLKDARTALAAGEFDRAIAAYEKAAAQGYAEGRAGIGLVHLRRRQYDKAQEQFELAQRMDGNLAMAWYGQGEVLRRKDDCPNAIAKLQRAVELDRKYPEAQLALGDCLVKAGRHADAVKVLEQGTNWGPKVRPRFLIALGDAELARDSLRDAGIFYTRAQQEAPDDPATNRALGEFYVKRGIGALAVQNLERAVQLDSSDVELRFALGQAFYFAQRYNEALDQYKYVADKDPEFAPGQYALGHLYYLSGQADPRRYADARPYLEKYTQMMPQDAKGWSALGRDLYFLKERDAATAALLKAEGLGDKSKEMYRILARSHVDKREWQLALAAYGKADLETTDLFRIAQVHAIVGDVAKADSVYAQMVDKDPASGEAKAALVEWGKLKYRQKDHMGAVATFQRRNALDPPSDEAFYYTGLAHLELKQSSEAIAALRRATEIAPEKGDRHFWLAMGLLRADSTDAAEAVFQRSVEIDSTSKNAALAFQQLGYRQLLRKDWSGAVTTLERAVAIDAMSVQSLVWLAQAHQNAGNKSKAIEYYRKVLGIQPGQPDAVKGLKLLGE